MTAKALRAVPKPWPRSWLQAEPERAGQASFTHLCYNVLCQEYVEPSHYPSTPQWALDPTVRREQIVKELQGIDADVMALQEVDRFGQWQSSLPKYDGVYKQRTGGKPDGCSIFWKKETFSPISHHFVEFKRHPHTESRDNVAVLVALRHLASQNTLLVANTHLLFNPKRGEIKLGQAQMLMNSIDRLVQHFRAADGKEPGVLVCGDFNSTPASAMFKYLRSGYLKYDALDRKEVDGQERHKQFSQECASRQSVVHKPGSKHRAGMHFSRFKASHTDNDVGRLNRFHERDSARHVHHDVRLSNVYSPYRKDREARCTSYHHRFHGMVDYILHSTDSLRLVQFLEVPEQAAMEHTGGLPAVELGMLSDHVLLAARLAFSEGNKVEMEAEDAHDEKVQKKTKKSHKKKKTDSNAGAVAEAVDHGGALVK